VSPAALVEVAALLAAALPEGSASYRLELAGVAVGAATLAIRCSAAGCEAAWTTRLRLPEEAGGELAEGRVELEVDREGRSRGGEVRVRRDGSERAVTGVAGAVPAMIAPVVLLSPGRAGGCLDVFEEETGVAGTACGERSAAGVTATIQGEEMRIAGSPDGFPAAIDIAGQRARWMRAGEAEPPARAPPIAGVTVDARPGASSFCGLAPDLAMTAPPEGALPHPAGAGSSCRAITLDYLRRAARAGREGRVAVGVAWTGDAFAWHAWAEVREGETWIPVDPTFGQLPAVGPRFTVARYAPDDAAARLEAGRRVLECLGRRPRPPSPP
jgi:hypothetical protein